MTLFGNGFQKRVSKFKSLFPKYRQFTEVVDYIDGLLTESQRALLELKVGNKVVDFKTQLLIHYEQRYDFLTNSEALKDRASKTLDRYQFLWDSGLEPWQIRNILSRELMEATTVGSQMFCLGWSSLCSNVWNSYYFLAVGIVLFRKHLFSLLISFSLAEAMGKRYPNLPWRVQLIGDNEGIYFLTDEINLQHQSYKLDHRSYDDEKGLDEFLRRTKWFFEGVVNCSEEILSKYYERILQEMNYSMGRDRNRFLSFGFLELGVVKDDFPYNTNTNLEEVSDVIVGCFSEEELERLKCVDYRGKPWSFREQIIDRYYSVYPSLLFLEEIKRLVEGKLENYRATIIGENSRLAKEAFMSELEEEIFCHKLTYFWNKEMMTNLNSLDPKGVDCDIREAVDLIIEHIGKENAEKLDLVVNGKTYDLRTQLLARWSGAPSLNFIRNFEFHLCARLIQNSHHLSLLPDRAHFQALLGEIDPLFLAPRKFRCLKWLLSRDDTDAICKWEKNLGTYWMCFSYRVKLMKRKGFPFPLFSTSFLLALLIVGILSLF